MGGGRRRPAGLSPEMKATSYLASRCPLARAGRAGGVAARGKPLGAPSAGRRHLGARRRPGRDAEERGSQRFRRGRPRPRQGCWYAPPSPQRHATVGEPGSRLKGPVPACCREEPPGHIRMRTPIHTHAYTCACPHTCSHAHTCMHACVHAHTHGYTCMHTGTKTCTHICAHACTAIPACVHPLSHMHACTPVCEHQHGHAHICMRAPIHTCACTHVHTHTCTHAYTHGSTLKWTLGGESSAAPG